MDVLGELVDLLDRKDVKHFKIFAGRSGTGDRKDIQLFNLIKKKGSFYDDEKAFELLYGGEDKNAFYRLRNRLTEDISKSIFLQQYRENEFMHCMFLTSISVYILEKGRYELAYYYFRKAERKAEEIENFGLLDIIYSQMIKVSREILSINPEVYIKKRRENREKLNKMSELEDVLEALEYRMKITQNYAQSSEELHRLLEKTVNEYTADESLKNSPKLQLDIYLVVSRILLQKKDYAALENYLQSTYEEFEKKGFFSKNTHNYKLQMLSWLANTAYKNKHYQRSLQVAEMLKSEMERFDNMLYDKYLLFYYNLLVINYSATVNPDKAIRLLEDLVKQDALVSQPYYGFFIFLNLAIGYYQKKNYGKALQALNRLYLHEGFNNMDEAVKLKIYIGELLMRYEQHEKDVLEYRLKQIEKDYKDTPIREDMKKEEDFISLFSSFAMGKYAGNKDKAFSSRVRKYLEKYEQELQEDEIFFRFDLWIKEKAGL